MALIGGSVYFLIGPCMVPILERVRRRVVALMKERGISQARLGALVGISPSHMSGMCSEADPRSFPIDKLDDIAQVLRVPTYSLFLDDPSRWVGRRDRRKGERRSGAERRMNRALAEVTRKKAG